MQQIKVDIERIEKLFGTDPGFYVVALHSQIESISNTYCNFYDEFSTPFRDKIDRLMMILSKEIPEIQNNRKPFVRLQKEHHLTNSVRHNFTKLSIEEAISSTYNFIEFCKICNLCKIEDLSKLLNNMEIWKKRTSPIETTNILKKLEFEIFVANRDKKHLHEKLSDYQSDIEKEKTLIANLENAQKELEEKSIIADTRKGKNDILRKEIHLLKQELTKIQNEKSNYGKDLEEYIEYTERLTHYSRTRRDYENSIIRLSDEQNSILNIIDFRKDFLIKGSAGTGKTLVLLKALEAANSEQNGTQPSNGMNILLTYTSTLVKYNKYLSTIIDGDFEINKFMTADTFINRIFKDHFPAYTIDYNVIRNLIESNNHLGFLSNNELLIELEDFILNNNITEKEYIDQRILRKGLQKPLNNHHRIKVWQTLKEIINLMESKKIVSKGYSRIKIIDEITNNSLKNYKINSLFVDESQDLSSAELKILKFIAGQSLIMAGDASQTIYGFSSPYARANIDLNGKSRSLKMNFRNTIAITEFAEQYKFLSPKKMDNNYENSFSFREGPIPELVKVRSISKMEEMLINKISFFINKIGYDPENICILCPTNSIVNQINELLATKNYDSSNIKERDFNFSQKGLIRTSTFHSSKGVDFPVVIMFIPNNSFFKSNLEQQTDDMQKRNLIYVGITRAMDNLTLISDEKETTEAVLDLQNAYNLLGEKLATLA